ncbi:MAG: hypothetical protein R2731_19155 [Nocardioides sp.]
MGTGPAPRAGQHRLGPHVVGQRVVIRSLVPGQLGPSGGPAVTDVLGVCEAWGVDEAVVRREDGTVLTLPITLIVSGKPVPPRPSMRLRIAPHEAQLRTLSMFPQAAQERLGDWVLRAAGALNGRMVARANSVLAFGDPGVPMDEATSAVVDFYRRHRQPAWAQVLADGDVDAELTGRGWGAARPGEADTVFQLAGVAHVLRGLDQDWDAAPPATLDVDPDGVRATLRLGEVARARLALDRDWVGLHDLWTDPARRGEGLMTAVLAEGWTGRLRRARPRPTSRCSPTTSRPCACTSASASPPITATAISPLRRDSGSQPRRVAPYTPGTSVGPDEPPADASCWRPAAPRTSRVRRPDERPAHLPAKVWWHRDLAPARTSRASLRTGGDLR